MALLTPKLFWTVEGLPIGGLISFGLLDAVLSRLEDRWWKHGFEQWLTVNTNFMQGTHNTFLDPKLECVHSAVIFHVHYFARFFILNVRPIGVVNNRRRAWTGQLADDHATFSTSKHQPPTW